MSKRENDPKDPAPATGEPKVPKLETPPPGERPIGVVRPRVEEPPVPDLNAEIGDFREAEIRINEPYDRHEAAAAAHRTADLRARGNGRRVGQPNRGYEEDGTDAYARHLAAAARRADDSGRGLGRAIWRANHEPQPLQRQDSLQSVPSVGSE